MTTLYFAHPTVRVAEGKEFQLKLEALGFKVLNPFVVNPVNKPGQLNKDGDMNRCRQVVIGDLRIIKTVDAVVVWLPEPSAGTSMEAISGAFWLGKPTFALFPGQIPHPWLKYLTVMTRTTEELLSALKAWKEGAPLPDQMKEFEAYRNELLMTTPKRLKIYVAGPFSAPTMEGIQENINRAIKAGNDVVRKGHHPYIPHLNFYQAAHESSPYGSGLASQNDRRWIDVDAPWVLACDAIYITPSAYEDKKIGEDDCGCGIIERVWKSRGAKHEYEQALKTGKLVFMKLDEIPQLPDFEGKN